jgi:hypothetical protein
MPTKTPRARPQAAAKPARRRKRAAEAPAETPPETPPEAPAETPPHDLAFATSPLGILLAVAHDEALPIALRVQAAKAALPFVHRRRAGEKAEPATGEGAAHERELERLMAEDDAAEAFDEAAEIEAAETDDAQPDGGEG